MCDGRSTRSTRACTPAPHDRTPAGDQLGHAAAVRTAGRAGEPDAEASRAARMGIVGRLLRTALAALQPGSRARDAPAGARRRHARAGAVARRARCSFRALWRIAAATQAAARRKVGLDCAPRRARRAPRRRATLRCAGLVRAALVGSSDRLFASIGPPACRGSRISAIRGPTARICADRRWQRRLWRRMEATSSERATALVFVNVADRRSRDARSTRQRGGQGARRPARLRSRRSTAAGAAAAGSRSAAVLCTPAGSTTASGRRRRCCARSPTLAQPPAARRRSCSVTLVGPPMSAHQRLPTQLGLDDVVEFTGRVSVRRERAQSPRRRRAAGHRRAGRRQPVPAEQARLTILPLEKPILGLTPRRGASADLHSALGSADRGARRRGGDRWRDRALLIDRQRQGRLGLPAAYREVAARVRHPPHDRACLRGHPRAVRVKPRVLMVTGAYFPETSGGGLQARAVIRALRERGRFLRS